MLLLGRAYTLALALAALVAAAAAVPSGPALAQTADEQASVAAPQTSGKPAEDVAGDEAPSIQAVLGPYGDPGGVRSFLAAKGVTYSLTYIGEVLGVASGGIRRGAIYEGRLDVQVDADLDKLIGWEGATFHTNVYQIHGHGLSRYYLANLMVASGIEALSSTRLYEIWLEQKLLDGRLSVRAGQLAADTEFLVSQTATLFVNSTFGWPALTATDLPSGGAAYPLATPGIRVKVAPTDKLSFLVGLFNGDPAGRANPFYGSDDPQILNRNGTNFRLRDPAFLIAEGAYALTGDAAGGLPGSLKLGYWHHFGTFNSQSTDTAGLSLADPSSTGIARRLRGNDGFYAVLDQTLYREAPNADQGLGAFVRLAGAPGDRNLASFYVDSGLAYKGLIPGRPNDTIGLAVAYLRVSDADPRLGLDSPGFTGNAFRVRDHEATVELTYQAEVVPGFTIQPDFQYLFRPGRVVVSSTEPAVRRDPQAAIAGIRATIRY